MTAQIPESLRIEGEEVSMCTEPLASYFSLAGVDMLFEATNTALWRGYVGSWEIFGSRLYLVDLKGQLKSGQFANIATVFPGFPDRVFAHWYSGVLRVPKGKRLRYVHRGYGSVYEGDEFITINRGLTISKTLVVNRAKPGPITSEDEYAVHALYSFASNRVSKGDSP